MSQRPLQDFVHARGPLAALAAAADTLLALDAAWQKLLPPALAGQCRAVRIRDDELVVFADNGMVAARLRMLGSSLLPALTRAGYPASRVKIKVDPVLHPAPRAKAIGIGERGIAALEAAAHTLPHPDIADALARFARHQRQRHLAKK